ncbi:peptidyl-tRNA hydrolase [Acrasis kona]|uniref:Peptidyl-tRNA hydrolase n=1 Tax=Acrasis kona TaxID=1008807 RepID=A0AAW2YKT0_9EUKA
MMPGQSLMDYLDDLGKKLQDYPPLPVSPKDVLQIYRRPSRKKLAILSRHAKKGPVTFEENVELLSMKSRKKLHHRLVEEYKIKADSAQKAVPPMRKNMAKRTPKKAGSRKPMKITMCSDDSEDENVEQKNNKSKNEIEVIEVD